MSEVKKQETEQIEEQEIEPEESGIGLMDKVNEVAAKLEEIKAMLTQLAEAIMVSADAVKGLKEVVTKAIENITIKESDENEEVEESEGEESESEDESIIEEKAKEKEIAEKAKKVEKTIIKTVTPRPELEDRDSGEHGDLIKRVLKGEISIGEIGDELKKRVMR